MSSRPCSRRGTPPPLHVLCNQIRIPDCSFITFRMGVEMGEAIAVATVFVEGGPIKPVTRTRSAWIVDKESGRVSGFHKVAFPAGTKLPSDALVLRRVRECAAMASDVEVRSLATALVSRPPTVIAPGLVVDPSTGRIRHATRRRATGATMLESVLRHSVDDQSVSK